MITVKDIMTTRIISAAPETGIVDATRMLLENRINGMPVVDDQNRLVGIICQSDLIAQQKRLPLPSYFNLLDSLIPLSSPGKIEREVQKISATRVADAMTPSPATVTPGTSIEDVAMLMVNKNFHTLPVLEDGKLVGVVGKEDVLRTLVTTKSSDA